MAKDWRVAVRAVRGGIDCVHTYCIHSDSAVPGAGDLGAQTIADDLATWLDPLIRPCLDSSYFLEDYNVRELGTSSPTAAVHTSHLAGTLAAGTGIAPLPSTLCVSLKTSLATRRGRGRFHMPAPAGSSYFASALLWLQSGAYWTAVTAYKDALLAGRDVTHDAILHHLSLRVWSPMNSSSRDVTSAVLKPDIRWIRRRQTAP